MPPYFLAYMRIASQTASSVSQVSLVLSRELREQGGEKPTKALLFCSNPAYISALTTEDLRFFAYKSSELSNDQQVGKAKKPICMLRPTDLEITR